MTRAQPVPPARPVPHSAPSRPDRPVPSWLGRLLLSLSAAGVPLVLILPRRFGRRGGLVVTAAGGVLLTRDAALTVSGAPARLRPLPRLLLFAEDAAAGMSVAAGLWAWGWARQRPGRAQVAAGAAAATLTLHTVRFAIYLSPGHGCGDPGGQ